MFFIQIIFEFLSSLLGRRWYRTLLHSKPPRRSAFKRARIDHQTPNADVPERFILCQHHGSVKKSNLSSDVLLYSYFQEGST